MIQTQFGPWFEVEEVVEALTADPEWVLPAISDGLIPAVRIGGRFLVPEAALSDPEILASVCG